MNFKKVLSIASVASLAVVGLASCGGSSDVKDGEYVGSVNVAASYNNIGYLTYGRGSNNLGAYTTIDGRELKPNKTLTPMWQDLAANMNVKIQDAALQADSTSCMESATIVAGYKGFKNRKVDVIQTTTGGDFNKEVNNGNILNLMPYIEDGKMPNLKAWLDGHPSIKAQIIANKGADNEGIYFTPYFDGLDQNEQQMNMNIDIVKALLDSTPGNAEANAKLSAETMDYVDKAEAGKFDQTKFYTTGFAYNTPFIESMDNQEIAVSKQKQTGLDTAGAARVDENSKANYTSVEYEAAKINVTIEAGHTIIDELKAVQAANSGITGEQVVNTLKTYLEKTYGKYVGEGKLYANYSDIFISGSACYNTDELIALFYAVKTNPGYLSGNATNTMVPFFPRTGEDGRLRRVISMMQIFGARGLEGEFERNWINAEGKLCDGRTQEYLLYGLTLINELQQDKLFPETEGWTTDGTTVKGDFRSGALADGIAFMCNDMSNVAAFNKSKTGKGKCYNITGVLPPVTKWAFTYTDGSNTKNANNEAIVGAQLNADGSSKGWSYTRFSEDDRSLKSGGWSIVAKAVKGKQEKLDKILKMFDYMYTPEGSVLECFGYNAQASEERKAAVAKKRSGGETAAKNYAGGADEYLAQDSSGNFYVNVTDEYKAEQVRTTQGTWHNFMTQYWGSCLGIGNIRTNYLEAQLTDELQKVGTAKLTANRGTGAYFLATTTGSNFLSVVKTTCAYDKTQEEANKAGDDLVKFWNQSLKSGLYYTVAMKGWSSQEVYNKPSTVVALFDAYNNSKLKNTGLVWGLTPDTTDQYSYINYKSNATYNALG